MSDYSSRSGSRSGRGGRQSKAKYSGSHERNVSSQQTDSTPAYDPFKKLYSYEAQRDSNNPQLPKQETKFASKQRSVPSDNYKQKCKYQSAQDIGYLQSGSRNSDGVEETNAVKKQSQYLEDSVNGHHRGKTHYRTASTENKYASGGISSRTNNSKFNMVDMKKSLPKLPVAQWLQNSTEKKVPKSAQKDPGLRISSEPHSMCTVECCINLTWNRRLCNGAGFVTYADHCHFKAVRDLMENAVTVLGVEVLVRISKKEKYQFYVTGIPPLASAENVGEAFLKLVPNVKPVNIELKFDPGFETAEDELESIERQIVENCGKYTNLTEFKVEVPKPKPTATIMKAFVNVADDTNLDLAALQLSDSSILCGRNINHSYRRMPVNSRPVYRLLSKCNLDICRALDSRFKSEFSKLERSLQDKFTGRDLFSVDITATDANTARIKVLTNQREILNQLQKIIDSLLEGEVLNESNVKHIERFFCRFGYPSFLKDSLLKDVRENEGVFVLEDPNAKIIRLFGPNENCVRVKKYFEAIL